MYPVRALRSFRRAICVVALGSGLWLVAAPTATHAAPVLRRSVYAVLAGTWLGRGLGDAGGCGEEYGQFTFFRNGEYAYTENSWNGAEEYGSGCGGITNAGYYRVSNGVIVIHWVECNFPCAPGTASARFAFLGTNAFELADQGGTYIYYRQ